MDRAEGEVHKLAKKDETNIFSIRTEQVQVSFSEYMFTLYVQVGRAKGKESLFNADAYTQTKTTWNNSDWLAHENATFYWSRFDTQRSTCLVNRRAIEVENFKNEKLV